MEFHVITHFINTEWYQRPTCPTNLRFKSNKNVAVLQWSMQQNTDVRVTEFIVGCGIVADGRHIYRVGPDKTEFEFVDLGK